MFSYSSPSTKRTAEKKFVLPAPLRPTMTLLLGEKDSVLTWFLYVLKPWMVMCLMWPMVAAAQACASCQFGLARAADVCEAWGQSGRSGHGREDVVGNRRLPTKTRRDAVCPRFRPSRACVILPERLVNLFNIHQPQHWLYHMGAAAFRDLHQIILALSPSSNRLMQSLHT